MAKKDKKKDKEPKKLKKAKAAGPVGVQDSHGEHDGFPDEIAGVKVPPKLRQAAEQLRDLAKNPVAQDIASDLAAAALMAAAAKIAGSPKTHRAVAEGADAIEEGAEKVGRAASASGDAMKAALLNAARTLLNNIDVGGKPKP